MSSYRQAVRVAIALAFAAGGVDAVGYLTLNHLFTAHMSGNTDAFGVAFGQADLGTLAERGVPIGLFVLGIAIGTAIVELEQRRVVRHPFIAVYTLELLLLAAFWGLSGMWAPTGTIGVSQGWPFFALAALLTLAMGLQNATLRRVGHEVVHTTYVTSLLTSLGEALAHLLVPGRGQSIPPGERIAVMLALWGGYVVGAAFASLMQSRLSFGATGVPLLALAVVIVIDVRQPRELGGEAQ